jgi:CRISPR-associated protein Cmr4
MPESALLFIHALTGLHPGSGTALGVVDLPVQRERHTQWPTIPGSSIKGVLREACRRRAVGQGGNGADDGKLTVVFGPETDNASDHAGALALTDARILAFPVRSMRGVFAWVTCPAVLSRLQRDLRLAKLPADSISSPEVANGKAACVPDSPLRLDTNKDKMVLEEFDFGCTAGDDVKQLAEWLAQASPEGNERVKQHLAVLHDDDFTHFVRHATEVTARVGLNYETKTVKKGALFYEEFLPAETIFYSLVLAEDSRSNKRDDMKAANVLGYLREKMPSVLQIGAGETIGKGLCAVRLWKGEEAWS